jgi:hypothetical protein
MPTDIRQIVQGETGEQGDIYLKGGSGSYDIVWAESTYQHQRDILLAQDGEIRQRPDAGVGLLNYQDDEGPEALLQKITEKLAKDGCKVKTVTMTKIDAPYPKA